MKIHISPFGDYKFWGFETILTGKQQMLKRNVLQHSWLHWASAQSSEWLLRGKMSIQDAVAGGSVWFFFSSQARDYPKKISHDTGIHWSILVQA